MNDKEAGPAFSFLGGSLPLDYCNTVDWHSSAAPVDRLHGYADVVAWAIAAETLSPESGAALLNAAKTREPEAEAAFRKALDVREGLFRIFSAVAHGEPPARGDVEMLNGMWREVGANLSLDFVNDAFVWQWQPGSESAWLRPLYPVIRAAVELLTSTQAADVRRCEGPPGCGWLFLDHTKNHSRRWCSMRDCGNRAKMRRFQERKKGKPGSNG
ncbi:ABATE domain-containing protein [Paenibacillus sp.]|uniref:CGNR zinc finger domain-containing protein n=1 Tax=Paenibacillus sp. TaxID=58172 RepID=UPI0028122BDA|nr:ABATE domain-containing protein [Paenibacillus sp.]